MANKRAKTCTLQEGRQGPLARMTLTCKNKGSTALPPKNARKCGANVVHLVPKAPRESDFDPSHRHDLDFL